MKRKMLSVLLCLAMALTMIPGMVLTAGAADESTTLDISQSSLYLRNNSGTQYSRNNSSWTSYTGTLTVTGATTSKIISAVSGNHTVVFSGMTINVSGSSNTSAVLISDNATLNVVLSGTNAVKSGANRPGIDVAEYGKLTITSIDGSGAVSGQLTATGGSNAAGIGARYGKDASGYDTAKSGRITINGGTVIASGGQYGAGIGGGRSISTTTGLAKDINITGGSVTATGGEYGAGIGGGGGESTGGKPENITISGGSVTATGGFRGAGIGGGGIANVTDGIGGNGGTVTISGGSVTANGDESGIGIGSGNHGNGGTVTISGGSVTATGDDRAIGGSKSTGTCLITPTTFYQADIWEGTSAQTAYFLMTSFASSDISGNKNKFIKVVISPTSITLDSDFPTVNQQVAASYYWYTTDLSVQWYRSETKTTTGGTEIVSAIALTYIPTDADLGKYLYVVIKDSDGNVRASAVAANPVSFMPVTFSTDSPVCNTALKASTLSADAITSQWYRSDTESVSGGTEIVGATGLTYTPTGADLGKYLYVVITDSAGSFLAAAVTKNTVSFVPVTFSTDLTICNYAVTASSSSYTSDLSVQWYRSAAKATTGGTAIDGANSLSYTPTGADVGSYLYVVISNANGNAVSAAVIGSTVTQLATLDINDGPVYLRVSSDVLQYSRNNSSWTQYSLGLCITGTSTVNTVKVQSGEHMVLFDNLSINVSATSDAAAVSISDNATLNVVLSGTSTLASGANCAGIDVAESGKLTVTDIGGYGELSGVMNVTGGDSGAGIGAGFGNLSNGDITINGGTITAAGGNYGAGIGGGRSYNDTTGNCGVVNINGGSVTANGGYGSAGIGGGGGYVYDYMKHGQGGTVTITGGSVTANGENNAAGIGGGDGGSGGSVTITGGSVTANGGSQAAGIGGGAYGSGGSVTISGGSVTANGGSQVAGIGDGKVTISGGSVKASSIQSTPTNGDANGSQALSLVIKTFTGHANKQIVMLTGLPSYYGTNDIYADTDGTVYLYLPSGYTENDIGLISSCEVTFDSQGGSTVGPIFAETGKTITLPDVPTRTDYTFGGWYTEANDSGTPFTAQTAVTSDITVYAKWTFSGTLVFTVQPSDKVMNYNSISGSLTAGVNAADTMLAWYACDSTGTVSGTSLGTGGSFLIPTDLAVGTYYYLCRAALDGQTADSRVATLTVNIDINIDDIAPAAATTGIAYSLQLTVTGTEPISWSVSNGTLPSWMTLNTETGLLSGTPTGAGTYTFTIQAGNTFENDQIVLTVSVFNLPGDIDRNGAITTNDALIALRAAVGKIILTEEQITIIDRNLDGKVTTTDALMVLKKAIKPDYVFPSVKP